ncbi:hypothetical protein [Plastoroseomonas arctica]|uniref:Uncharacterized protein n=1 Tax=Plastoroseomonas arctica TaxID=1509237 RepID=A0AAF1JWY4_9PROT|nr:hypothetical protein [Plastoroseomonas arctica]MBR0655654.1 hypothetical protein [Plastoroseomonas arctica]
MIDPRWTRRAVLLGAASAPFAAGAQAPRDAPETDDESERRDPPALATPRPVRLAPNAAPVVLSVRPMSIERVLVLSFAGEDGPPETITLPSWYGFARVFAVLPLRGREVVLASFEGVTGTGVYQEIAAIIGREDGGALRILGLETLRYRNAGTCDGQSLFTGRFTAQPDGVGLRYDVFARGLPSACPPRRASAGWREEFGTTLRWSGSGVLMLPVRRGEAGRTRIRVETARARAHAWLRGAPRVMVTLDDVRRLGLMETLGE